ncbi:MAG: hypothetical protein SFV24_17630 [Gemmatimonadales bacterium]|nr:hypothetical protein [Gemmatimonadales bacterium]
MGDGRIPTQFAREVSEFPASLRALIEAELAAGNSIDEIGHSHPAPPAGAYVKLARKVTTRVRAADEGLDFYERNSSIYSGEFTDARRFYFVIEPPNPPPPEPDMDAIRKALEPKPDPLVRLAERVAGTSKDEVPVPADATTNVETATSRHFELHFRDPRPPHLIQAALEREVAVPFPGQLTDGELRFRGRATVIGAPYQLELRFVAALPNENCYRLTADVSWADQSPANHDYFRGTSASWLRMWTREFTPASPPRSDQGVAERYRLLAEAALGAETHLDSVAAVQAAIVAGVKGGGRFATSHKEGGSTISWRGDRFLREDYGDDPDTTTFKSEGKFLDMLWRFCQHEVTRNAGQTPFSELETWKLILRQMIAP